MKIEKSPFLSCASQPLAHQGRLRQSVTIGLGFDLARSAPIPADQAWAAVIENLPESWCIDSGLPKKHAEWLLAGSAGTAGRTPRSELTVEIEVGVSRRSFSIRGHYREDGAVSLFSAMPLSWENTFGYPESPDNPLGHGELAGRNGRIYPPEVRDTRDAANIPACPGPRGAWPCRMRNMGTYDGAWLKQRWPGPPDDCDWSFYNLAQPAQHLPSGLRGDEALRLTGLHHEHPVILSRLPGKSLSIFVDYAAAGSSRKVLPVLDTLWLFPNVQLGLLLWHALIPCKDEIATDIERLRLEMDSAEPEPLADFPPELRPELSHESPPAPPPGLPADFSTDFFTNFSTNFSMDTPEERPTPHETSETGWRSPRRGAADGAAQGVAQGVVRGIAQGIAQGVAQGPVGMDLSPVSSEDSEAVRQAFAGALEELEEALDQPDEAVSSREQWGPGVDLSGQRLAGVDFSGMNLAGADFSGARLTGARFVGSILRGVDFSGADMAGADLSRADLDGASLLGVNLAGGILCDASALEAVFIEADLSRVNMSGLRAAGADFIECVMEGAALCRAGCAGANFTGVRAAGIDARGADFSKACLREGDFSKTVFTNAILREADICSTTLDRAVFQNADCGKAAFWGTTTARNCDFTRAILAEGEWEGVRADESLFTRVQANGARFIACGFARTSWRSSLAVGADFSRSVLRGAEMSGANLLKASFREAVLQGADCTGANLYGADFYRCVFDAATRMRDALLGNTLLTLAEGS